MLTKKTKYNLASILTFLIGLATLLTLLADLYIMSINGNKTGFANGFAFLIAPEITFNPIITPAAVSLIKFFLSMQLIIAIASMLLPLISSLFFEGKKIYIGFNIACFISTISYLIISLLLTNTLQKFYEDEYKEITIENLTASFVGIVITGILLIAFFVLGFALKTKNEEVQSKTDLNENIQPDEPTQNTSVELSDITNTAEALKQYKSMFDLGLINEEDFNSIKEKLLSKIK